MNKIKILITLIIIAFAVQFAKADDFTDAILKSKKH
jgi:hypothetical protein